MENWIKEQISDFMNLDDFESLKCDYENGWLEESVFEFEKNFNWALKEENINLTNEEIKKIKIELVDQVLNFLKEEEKSWKKDFDKEKTWFISKVENLEDGNSEIIDLRLTDDLEDALNNLNDCRQLIINFEFMKKNFESDLKNNKNKAKDNEENFEA